MVKNENKEVYLIFCDSGNWLFKKILKKGFSHVFLCEKHPRGWAIVDPSSSYLKTYTCNKNVNLPLFYLKKGFSDLKITSSFNEKKRFLPKFMPIVTCVTIAKYATMVKSKSVTPWGFYNFLINNSHNQIKVEVVK